MSQIEQFPLEIDPPTSANGETEHDPLINIEETANSGTYDKKKVLESGKHFIKDFFSDQGYLSATFNFTNGAVGVGILMLPFVLKESGIFLGLIFLLISGFMGAISQWLLYRSYIFCIGKASEKSNEKFDYEDLGEFFYGKICSFFIQICLFLNCYGCVISYTIIVGDLLIGWFNDVYIRSIVLFFVVFPFILISMSEKITSIRYFSYFSVFTTAFFIVVIVVLYFTGDTIPKKMGKTIIFPDFTHWEVYFDIISIMGIVIFSYDSSTVLINIAVEYKKEKVHRVGISIYLGCCIMFFMYSFIAEFGYLSFLDNTRANIIKNYEKIGWIEHLLVALLGLAILFTYPLGLYPARYTFINLVDDLIFLLFKNNKLKIAREKKKYLNLMYHCVVTLVIGVSCYIIAVVYPYVADVYNIVGATISVATTYFFPCLFYLKTLSLKEKKDKRGNKWWDWRKIVVYILLCSSTFLGFFVTIVSIVNTFIKGSLD